jgi:ubiquinone biosynthesis protein UbiJ
MVVERDEAGEEHDVDVCMTDPGHSVTLTVTARLRTLVDVLMGDAKLGAALRRGLVKIEGDRELARRFEELLVFEDADSHSYVGRRPVEPDAVA